MIINEQGGVLIIDRERVVILGVGGPQGATQDISGLLVKASNLSDLASASTARTNLGLGTAATRDVGQLSGNVLELSANNTASLGNATTEEEGIIRLFDNAAIQFSQLRSVDGALEFNSSLGARTVAFTSDLTALQSKAEVRDANFTAANDGVYTITASATVTDPSPVEGRGYTVFVRNGTLTQGANTFSTAGTILERIFHSGAWANYTYSSGSGGSGSLTIGTSAITGGTSGRVLYNNAGVLGELTTSGSGTVLALTTSPTFTTPALGTPSSGTLTNCTGYPTATTSTSGIVPTIGAMATTSAASMGLLFSPSVDQLRPYHQIIYENDSGVLGLLTASPFMTNSNYTMASGRMVIVPFSHFSKTISTVTFGTGAAGSGLTLCKVAIYEADGWPSGNGNTFFTSSNSRRVAVSNSFTTLALNTAYTISLTSSLALDFSKRYYIGLLQVGTTPAQIRGVAQGDGLLPYVHPCPMTISSLSDAPTDLSGAVTSNQAAILKLSI